MSNGTSPATPPHVVASGGDSWAVFSWTYAEGANDYEVRYRASGGAWQAWPFSGDATYVRVTGLTNGVTYEFQVRSVGAAGVSAWSLPATAVPEYSPATNSGLPQTLPTTLVNQSNTDTVYAYVVGLDMDDNRWIMVSADGQSTYKPPIPSENHTPIPVDCAIPVGARGESVDIVIPRMASGRLFFSYDKKIEFFMNTNGGFVMPSQLNINDENIDTQWTFAEFTLNNVELYGNISFVDMLSIPIAFKLEVSDGTGTQFVEGLPAGAMGTIGRRLVAAKTSGGGDWDKCLFYNSSNELVRILSPNSVVQIDPTAFDGYLDQYVDEVWAKYAAEPLTVNTNRAEWGDKQGWVKNNVLDFGDGITFAKPSTASIWSCSIPPFTTGNDEQGNITARLAAAFNRTTLLINAQQPNGEDPATYYQSPATNHYSRIIHEEVYGKLGYTFPYDDVHPEGGISYEGRIQSSHPRKWTITIGAV